MLFSAHQNPLEARHGPVLTGWDAFWMNWQLFQAMQQIQRQGWQRWAQRGQELASHTHSGLPMADGLDLGLAGVRWSLQECDQVCQDCLAAFLTLQGDWRHLASPAHPWGGAWHDAGLAPTLQVWAAWAEWTQQSWSACVQAASHRHREGRAESAGNSPCGMGK